MLYHNTKPKFNYDPLSELVVINEEWVVPYRTLFINESDLTYKFRDNIRVNFSNNRKESIALNNSGILKDSYLRIIGNNGRNLTSKIRKLDTYMIILGLLNEDRIDEVNRTFLRSPNTHKVKTTIEENDKFKNWDIKEVTSREDILNIVKHYDKIYTDVISCNKDQSLGNHLMYDRDYWSDPRNYWVNGYLMTSNPGAVNNPINYIEKEDSYIFIVDVKDKSKAARKCSYRIDKETGNVLIDMIRNNSYSALIDVYLTGKLLYINKNKDVYSKFYKKEPTKTREINAPDGDIKESFRSLNELLSSKYEGKIMNLDVKGYHSTIGTSKSRIDIRDTVYGYRPNLSVKDNASVHALNNKITGDNTIIKIDIEHFFDSVMYEYFESTIIYMYYNTASKISKAKRYNKAKIKSHYYRDFDKVMRELLLNPESNGLYMGNPVSGTLSNSAMLPVVRYMISSLYEKGIRMTIYADDMTFSKINNDEETNKYFNIKYISYIFNKAVETNNRTEFKLKEEKSLTQRNTKRKVTGVKITEDNNLTWHKSLYKYMRHILYMMDRYNKPLSDFTTNKDKLCGNIAFYIHTDTNGKMNRLLNKYKDVLIRENMNIGGIINDNITFEINGTDNRDLPF